MSQHGVLDLGYLVNKRVFNDYCIISQMHSYFCIIRGTSGKEKITVCTVSSGSSDSDRPSRSSARPLTACLITSSAAFRSLFQLWPLNPESRVEGRHPVEH